MATLLRAFLMVRDVSRQWRIDVHRELEGLLDAWRALEGSIEAGVLHVGFDRPASSLFDEVADRFPNHMLLTAGARFSLPSDFVSSKNPVAEVEGLAVFLGLRGWGYLAEDLEAAYPTSVAALQPPEGWVKDYLDVNPRSMDAVREAGISNEASYLVCERGLDASLRHDIGRYRYRRLIEGRDSDPCEIARAAPPWLAERAFSTMGLSVRAANVFINHNIETVGDLAAYSTVELLRIPNFGRTSVGDVVRRLTDALAQGPFSISDKIAGANEANLLSGIRRSLLSYSERERSVIIRRMGLEGKSETLQDIGRDYGITRERIRQIESKVVRKLRQDAYWDDLLDEKLTTLLHNRNIPLPLIGIDATDEWFSGISEYPDVVQYLISNFSKSGAGIINIDGIKYISLLSQEQWDSALSEGRRLLQSGVGKGWSESYCQKLIDGLLPENAQEYRAVLWEQASNYCNFSGETADRYLVSYGRGADQAVEAVLCESPQPLHYFEIARLASEKAGREIDVRRAHNAAAAVGILLGRGTYGVERHLPLTLAEMSALALEAEEVVEAGPPGRQWHSIEIRAALIEAGSLLASTADRYVLDNALLRSGTLERLGRMTWAARQPTGDPEARIELRQAIIAALQQSGRPLGTNDIRQRLNAIRGVGPHFQIIAADPLIRVGPGLWGLNDRDLPIKRPDQAALMDKLAEALLDRGSGIHVSELPLIASAVSAIDPRTILSLASSDERFRVNQAQYLYLSRWGEPRRESVSEAVEIVLIHSPYGIGLDDLVTAVTDRIGRDCDRRAVSASLQGLEAKYDQASGLWSPAIQEQVDLEAPLDWEL